MSNDTPRARFFVHPQGLCESVTVGDGTRVWAFAHVLPGARIGADCNICDHVFVENDVVIGDRVTVKCGVQLWDGLRVADDVFIGPNVTLLQRQVSEEQGVCVARPAADAHRPRRVDRRRRRDPARPADRRARDGRRGIGRHPRRAGAGDRVGQPGADRRLRRRDPAGPGGASVVRRRRRSKRSATSVGRVTLHRFRRVDDLRGTLSAGEFPTQVPFVPQRYFMVFDVPSKEVRGEHAHRKCHQFLVCARGSLTVVVDDGTTSEEIVLDAPHLGLYLPPMIWAVQYKYSEDALLLVFASDPYDPADYIRDYEEFRALIAR